MEENTENKKELFRSLIAPTIIVLSFWLVKSYEHIYDISLSSYGLEPLSLSGLKGVLFSPFLHADWHHLFNNTPPVFLLTWAVSYFYRDIALKIIILLWIISGLWLWCFARGGMHIGASGLVYGLGAFVFLSGILRRNRNLLALSLLVTFLYGSMVWGIFPMEIHISWESHLMGLFTGILLAFFYRHHGPEIIKATDFDDENDFYNSDDNELPYYKDYEEED